jgi:hypothetical protein
MKFIDQRNTSAALPPMVKAPVTVCHETQRSQASAQIQWRKNSNSVSKVELRRHSRRAKASLLTEMLRPLCRQVAPFVQATKALGEIRGISLLCF